MSNTTQPSRIDPGAVATQARAFIDESTAWFGSHWLEIVIAVAVGTGIVVLLHVVRRAGISLCDREPGVTGWGTVLGRAIARTGNIFMIILAARMVTGYAGTPPSIEATIATLFTIAMVLQSALWIREIILGVVEHKTETASYGGEALGSAMGIIRLLVTVAVFAIALVVVLDNLGVNVTGLVAGLGVGGIAIGLAAQGIFADLFAALSIIFDKPFRKGDSISYDETQAKVEAIGLKTTRLRSFTGEERIISNTNLLDKEIRNNTRLDYRRVKFAIGVVYEMEPDLADRIPVMLSEIVEADGHTFVRAGLTSFGDSALNFEVEFDVQSSDFQVFYEARHRVGIAILKRFGAEGIAFAYPTQTSYTAGPDGALVLPYAPPGSH